MQEAQDIKMFFYVDESGDPTILARKGRNLLAEGLVSKTFIIGYVETSDPKTITYKLEALRKEVLSDEYLRGIPSLRQTETGFHANSDAWEVKERVFKLLKTCDFKTYMVVARKSERLSRNKFDFDTGKIYSYLVTKLFENRLHKYQNIDIYFSTMCNVVRERTMRSAIDDAIELFKKKWGHENTNTIRILIQKSSMLPMLQVVDYMLWTVHRVYEKSDYRFYNYMKDKISLEQDVFDTAKYPKTYYTPDNPLEEQKISPLGG